MFLILLSQYLYAPSYDKITKQHQIALSEKKYLLTEQYYQNESKLDEKDFLFIKKYHMTKYFGIKERSKLRKISKELDIKPEWLYKTIFIECGGDIYKPNPYSGAVGAIQFTPATANALGTDTSQIKKMSMCQQLDLVKNYIQKISNGHKISNVYQLYLLVFFPNAAYQNGDFIIGNNHTKVFKYNQILCNKEDTTLTVSHIRKFLDRIFII